jgi:AraC-like DNA-binding protein
MIENGTSPRDPFLAIWPEIKSRACSGIGQLAALSSYRHPTTTFYHHDGLAEKIGSEEANRAIFALHELAWATWLDESFEQKKSDLLSHLHNLSKQTKDILRMWLDSEPFLLLIPDSAKAQERSLFTGSIIFLLNMLYEQYSSTSSSITPKNTHAPDGPVGRLLWLINNQYSDPSLSLTRLSAKLHLSERHLGRLFHHQTGTNFRQYLQHLRMHEAARLLAHSAFDVKMIAGMVGYHDPSHFGKDFKIVMGSTPRMFRFDKPQRGESESI